MSDVNQAQEAPAAGEAGGPLTDFDKSFQEFMSHDFGQPEGQEEDAGSAAESGESSETAPAGNTLLAGSGNDTISGQDTISASSGEGTDSAGAPASSGDASTVQGDAGADVVDPAMLAAMQGFSTPGPKEGLQTPPAASDKVEPAPAASSEEEEKDFMPFTPDFKLAPAVTQALFESEDPEVREKALVGLLSSYGNAIAATVVHHMQKQVLPATLTRYSEGVVQEQTRNAVTTSFYSAFPELDAYRPAVQKAFAVIAEKEKGLVWGEETATKIARLTVAALRASGIPVEVARLKAPATGEKPPLPPVDLKKAPGSGFEAGGSRLSSDNLNSSDGPANLVKELTEHW